ncbi:recombinase family protein [Kutzneria sp. CA-103260]|uniref:recombinase family protein n=1 Tax=Kutzneria sp. CA-103260 TaxID=2802641 RepID=UPI0020133F72|nr:recombinase family protein [Kutzneria sp. CA-103260]
MDPAVSMSETATAEGGEQRRERRVPAACLGSRVGEVTIARGLSQDGIGCPSARRPGQNRHRRADGWQDGTVRAILQNPRYTSYAVFGRWTKHEELINPDDVAAGHIVRFRRSHPQNVVRSRRPAHPAIVTVGEFTRAQLRRRSHATNKIALPPSGCGCG